MLVGMYTAFTISMGYQSGDWEPEKSGLCRRPAQPRSKLAGFLEQKACQFVESDCSCLLSALLIYKLISNLHKSKP